MNPLYIAKSLVPLTFRLPYETGGTRLLKADLQDGKLRVRDVDDWSGVTQTLVAEFCFSASSLTNLTTSLSTILQGNSAPKLLDRKHTLFYWTCPAFMQAVPLPECPFPALYFPRPLALQGPAQISLPFKTSPVLL